MQLPAFEFHGPKRHVVGSFGDVTSLREATPGTLATQCDIAEIRLDLFYDEFTESGPVLWKHLKAFPLLFTARCEKEGSPISLTASQRSIMLESALPDATLIDIELSSSKEMARTIQKLKSSKIPWIASYHNFMEMPSLPELQCKRKEAEAAGAAAFKCAARMNSIDDVADLVKFQMSDSAYPVATMGMGNLGPASRLLCAQAGSILNYGFIGATRTAPGQWSADQLFKNIQSLEPIS